ncbi:hypothetical protein M595_1864 [Lyngbya aestuarii BL J]|uniref:Uncharacterized protein n=1 Tax=Lyngbya aestuarii BL J TaxID=1348334 RepID=U7QJE1_9CYAN|nr:hypothetical protein [Lyngbya aestuarii]ERT08084.1 hypothetical protein M595_1864 [Lyngbya aestuarii BL J]
MTSKQEKNIADFIDKVYIHDWRLNIRLGNEGLKKLIESLPEEYIKDTEYNKHSLKWFKFRGIDTKRQEIKIEFRLRVKKYENVLVGRVKIYDNAWDVKAGLKLEVDANRKLTGKITVRDHKSDIPSGILGIFDVALSSISTGSLTVLNSIFTGNLFTFSSAIIGKKLDGLSQNIPDYVLKTINDKAGKYEVVYLERVKYKEDSVIIQTNTLEGVDLKELL